MASDSIQSTSKVETLQLVCVEAEPKPKVEDPPKTEEQAKVEAKPRLNRSPRVGTPPKGEAQAKDDAKPEASAEGDAVLGRQRCMEDSRLPQYDSADEEEQGDLRRLDEQAGADALREYVDRKKMLTELRSKHVRLVKPEYLIKQFRDTTTGYPAGRAFQKHGLLDIDALTEPEMDDPSVCSSIGRAFTSTNLSSGQRNMRGSLTPP